MCLSSFKKKISVLPRVKRSSNVHDLTSVTTHASHGNLLRIVCYLYYNSYFVFHKNFVNNYVLMFYRSTVETSFIVDNVSVVK